MILWQERVLIVHFFHFVISVVNNLNMGHFRQKNYWMMQLWPQKPNCVRSRMSIKKTKNKSSLPMWGRKLKHNAVSRAYPLLCKKVTTLSKIDRASTVAFNNRILASLIWDRTWTCLRFKFKPYDSNKMNGRHLANMLTVGANGCLVQGQ